MLWSRKREEAVAETLLQIEIHDQHLRICANVDKKTHFGLLKKWKQCLFALRIECKHGWEFFVNGWLNDEREYGSDGRNSERIQLDLEGCGALKIFVPRGTPRNDLHLEGR